MYRLIGIMVSLMVFFFIAFLSFYNQDSLMDYLNLNTGHPKQLWALYEYILFINN